MKNILIIAMLTSALSAMASEVGGKPGVDRLVADRIESVTLPNGEVSTRLVSNNRVTSRQFWIDSVYHGHESILVYQGKYMDLQQCEKFHEPRQLPSFR